IRREVEAVWTGALHEHDVRDMDVPLPRPSEADGFIITGSSSSVTERAPWMLRAEALVRELHAMKTPLFGICFGHQMIGEALGGKVAKNPHGREIGTVHVRTLDGVGADPILAGLPRTFTANATHVDSVVKLPPDARVLAETDLEPHAVFAVGETTRGVQFHPEIDGDAMRGYVDARAHLVNAEGLDAQAIRDRSIDTPHGAETLRNFVRHVVRFRR
ncbi:MAG: synthase, partial [Labilithrix sp.]|nr:synthase [Labilithrix sp.]